MYKRIIIGYDGTDGARDALAMGRKMAEFENAAIRVVFVYSYEPMGRAATGELNRLLRIDADAELAGARQAFAGRPDTEFVLVPGYSPPRELHRIAEEWQADLIVVGSSGRAGWGHIAVGRVGEQTLHGSACRVLVAPWGYRDVEAKLERVGVAHNGSEESRPALEEAAALADAADAELLIVNVVDIRSHDLDLLVVGSRDYGRIRRILLGSVSARLVHAAACPILVLPRAARGSAAEPELTPVHTTAQGDPR